MNMDHTRDMLPSLLWPRGHDRDPRSQGLTDRQAADLSLDVLVRSLDWSHRHARQVRGVLMSLLADPAVIAYRQQIMAELAENEPLRDGLEALLPSLADLAQPRAAAWAHESPLLLVPPRLSDLDLYVECVDQLHGLLNTAPLRSDGLRALQEYVAAVRDDEEFQAMAAELPALRSQLDHVRSVTVGVNLDGDLRPIAATLVAVNTEPFSGPKTLTHRLLGRSGGTGTPGMTALRTVSERSPDTDPLARDLQHVLGEVIQPVATALERYGRIHARPLAALDAELSLCLGAIKLADRLRSQGLPMCLPHVSSAMHTLSDAYNLSLALQLALQSSGAAPSATLILNAIDFEPGRIVFLTGPNRGGKTTYLRAIGLNQVLFQAGLFVAARAAEMIPTDAILTHFPTVEGSEAGAGRLDDEARRLREIFGQATSKSLLLFNEPLTSTGEAEAQVLAEDVLRALRLLGARAVYITHLHALASELDALNDGPGATIASWVAGVGDDAARTYVIRLGTPTARSHAATIAQQHGITFDQLARQLAERGAIDQPKTRS